MTLHAATRCFLAAALVLTIGCGESDEDTSRAPPEPAVGGGVRGAPLAGKLDVFVIDSVSAAPIAGAEVLVGEGAQARALGTTDADGHLGLSDPALTGAQSVAARAPGYAAAAWLGVAASELTLPLAPLSAGSEIVSVTATIAGWETLPPPAAGKRRVARLRASHPISLGALDAVASAPPVTSDTCVADASGSSCTFSLDLPRTAKRLLAVIAEGDDAGLRATGLALLEVDLQAQSQDLSLELAPAAATTSANVTPASAPSAVFVIGVPGVAADQQVLVFPAFSPPLEPQLIPVGEASGSLWAMAVAGYADGASVAMQRGLPLPSAAQTDPVELATPAFLELPDASAAASGFNLVRSSEAELCSLRLTGAAGSLDVLVLDGRALADPPSALVPTGPLELDIAITDASLEAQSFVWADVVAETTRRAFRRRSLP